MTQRLRSVPRTAWIAAGAVVLLLAPVAVAAWPSDRSGAPTAAWSAPDASRSQPPVVPLDGTSCAANAAGMAGFTPVAAVDVPARATGRPPAYVFDRTAAVARGFDRVGYCLELNGPAGPQWVWTAMEPFTTDARRLGLPTRAGQIVQQRVNDLEVATNVAGLPTGTGLAGYLEMWPNSYGPRGTGQISGTAPDRYDADDDVQLSRAYGSFQVHLVGGTRPADTSPQTVLAVNGFMSPSGPLALGIGPAPTGNPDWTFAANAGSLTQRRLTVYARPSVLTVTRHPADRQLFPRDAGNGAVVEVAGKFTDPRVTAVQLKVTSGADGWDYSAAASPGGTFSLRHRITAALREYRFELRVLGDGVARRVGRWDGVVAGDVYVIEGQSNAVAAMQHGSAAAEESPYLRSFGSPVVDGTRSAAARSWNYAVGDLTQQPGAVGQWGIRMAHRLSDTYQVPVAVINGAENGRPIGYFQRVDTRPNDLRTNYGRLRQRLTAAGVVRDVRGVLWYQGEADNDNAAAHVAGFTALLRDWRAELGGPDTRYYVFQVRTSPCGDGRAARLREAQRRMGDTLGVTVLSTNGLSGQDGCHFDWEHGYRELGDHAFAVLSRDLYRGPADGVAPPNPRSASFVDPGRTAVVVRLRDEDPLTVQPGVAADFRIEGSGVSVVDVTYRPGGQLVLTLSGPATGATGVSYLGHAGAGPCVVKASGVGLLTFQGLPIAAPD
ncbi:sialate O-acetylesterase [Micromonospora sp. HK10]|uniref:sialate O-acetylesterase n=1 Tax=Micromonospora sp. HK10 TaxID=1538294 RepID=UPI0012E252BE|nr:sialate O-acetylesterase [Micromonospora sp. HK10]